MISDEYMHEQLAKSREYSVVFLLPGPNYDDADRALIWEHGRRNFELRAAGTMNIVGPFLDGGNVQGMCIMNASVDDTRALIDEDPAVVAGIFTYEVHPMRSFPGDALG